LTDERRGGRPREAIVAYARATGHDLVLLPDAGRSLGGHRRKGSSGGMWLIVPNQPPSVP
jgi:hypothetical protein